MGVWGFFRVYGVWGSGFWGSAGFELFGALLACRACRVEGSQGFRLLG